MLSVFLRAMLVQSHQACACSIRQRMPLLTTKQPQQFWNPDLTDDMHQACSMLSVFSRAMLVQSHQACACSICLRMPLLPTKQPQQFWNPNIADNMCQACIMLCVFSRGMLALSNQVRQARYACGRRCSPPSTRNNFRTRFSLMACARSAPCFLCSRVECYFNHTGRAHDRYAYGRRCSQASNRNNFRDPDLTDDTEPRSAQCFPVVSQRMLLQSNQGAHMLDTPAWTPLLTSKELQPTFAPGSR